MDLPPFPPPPALPDPPRVSVVVVNHDYEAYLPAALASALNQRGAEVDVVVVDDGSTDGSRAIIAAHEGRVRAVLQERGGQKAAFNAGLEAAEGDVVLFLDADDELRPGAAAAVAAAFADHPGASRVGFPLEVVDEAGHPGGGRIPTPGTSIPQGDVRREVLAFGDDLAWPPTSGNAFAAWALRRVMPLEPDDDPTGADTLLHPLLPLLGPVVSLDVVGGSYRQHGANAHLRAGVDVARSRVILRRAARAHAATAALAAELGLPPAAPRSVTLAAHRLLSLRLGGPGHPVPGDNRRRAALAGVRAARGRWDVGPRRRAAYAAWFLAVAVLPRPAVRRLGAAALQPLPPRP